MSASALVVVGSWAEKITAAWRASIENIMLVGALLLEAKGALPHGEFEAMVESDLPFGPSAARRLMAVSRHPLISDRAHVHVLPSSWGTLYELTKLPEPVLERALIDGTITPETQRAEVARLVDMARRPSTPSPESPTCTVDDIVRLAGLGHQYGTIYADPPWQYGNQATRAATDNHYSTMTVPEMAALPIAGLSAENAHLHVWTTNAFLFEAKSLIDAWGFEYKSALVWVKPQMGIGNYWRVSHEFLLLGVRGSCPFRDKGLMSWVEADRTEHSEKPDVVRAQIERASPGPYLELFGRRVSPGWTVWGNEIERRLFDAEVAL